MLGETRPIHSASPQVHFLDAGLPCRGAHLTDPAVAAALGRRSLPPRVALHGTPRQWRDPRRPWLAEEKCRSAALLRGSGVVVAEREYLASEPPSLHMHFRCVDLFALDCLEAEAATVPERGGADAGGDEGVR